MSEGRHKDIWEHAWVEHLGGDAQDGEDPVRVEKVKETIFDLDHETVSRQHLEDHRLHGHMFDHTHWYLDPSTVLGDDDDVSQLRGGV